jgi:hypothetical protein
VGEGESGLQGAMACHQAVDASDGPPRGGRMLRPVGTRVHARGRGGERAGEQAGPAWPAGPERRARPIYKKKMFFLYFFK